MDPHPRRPPPAQQDGGFGLATRMMFGAAFVVVLAAAALFFSGSPSEPDEKVAAETLVDEAAGQTPDSPLAPTNPLSITSKLLDAEQRAAVWDASSMLSAIELVVENGSPKGALEIEFGETIGSSVPGAPLSPKRNRMSYRGDAVEARAFDSPVRRVGLPSPTCPLEAAFRTLTQAGGDTSGAVAITYFHSPKHGRPVWMMSTDGARVYNINAESCTLLTR